MGREKMALQWGLLNKCTWKRHLYDKEETSIWQCRGPSSVWVIRNVVMSKGQKYCRIVFNICMFSAGYKNQGITKKKFSSSEWACWPATDVLLIKHWHVVPPANFSKTSFSWCENSSDWDNLPLWIMCHTVRTQHHAKFICENGSRVMQEVLG